MIFAETLPDFPETSVDGVAYIVDVSTKSKSEISLMWDSVSNVFIIYCWCVANVLIGALQPC